MFGYVCYMAKHFYLIPPPNIKKCFNTAVFFLRMIIALRAGHSAFVWAGIIFSIFKTGAVKSGAHPDNTSSPIEWPD